MLKCLLALLMAFTPLYPYCELPKEINVPIIMYHSVLRNADNTYNVSPELLENDIIYLLGKGYEFITAKELSNAFYKGELLPEKPIVLTFDDGHYNNYYYVFPLLKKYNVKITLAVVGEYIEETDCERHPEYSYLNYDEIREMHDSGYVEIACHSHSLHSLYKGRRGIQKKYGESSEEYIAMFTSDTLKLLNLLKERCKITDVTTYAYPFGVYNKEAKAVLAKMGFRSILTCNQGVNSLKKIGDLHSLKRNNRSPYVSRYDFFDRKLSL